MTLRNLLNGINLGDHTSMAKYPDGSGGEDRYVLAIMVNGHGKLLDAKVRDITIARGSMYIHSSGETTKEKKK